MISHQNIWLIKRGGYGLIFLKYEVFTSAYLIQEPTVASMPWLCHLLNKQSTFFDMVMSQALNKIA
jgi:hypothetical protein